jgi:formate/nitrite transporter
MAGMDAFAPAEIARLVQTRGVAKANAGIVPMFVLAVLAGAFIALGAMLSTVVGTGSELGYGLTKWLAGMAFSLGLILVVIAGAELFTGNNLIVMATLGGQVSVARLLRNWLVVWVGNLVGSVSVAWMVWAAKWWSAADGAVGATALTTAASKAALPFGTAFVRGVLANALVCLAVWLATGGRSVVDKVVAIVPPIAAFVAAGFEHSVANMYFIPLGLFLKGDVAVEGLDVTKLDGGGLANNLAAATLGNIVGGAVLVGVVYWFVYLRPQTLGRPTSSRRTGHD